MKTKFYILCINMMLVVILAACQGATVTPAPVQTDNTEQNMAIVRQVYDAIAAGDAETLAALHSNPFTLNYPGGSEEVDPQLMGEDLATLRNANPDLHAEIQDMYASGDIVVTQLTWRATHTGDFFGIPATGNPVVHNGVVVRRLENGKVVESWETFDDFEFLHSMGILPGWDEVIAQSSVPVAEATVAAPAATPTLMANQVIVTSSEQILGVWRGRGGSPGDPPQTYWWFQPDGTYRVAFELSQFAEGYSVEAGSYSFDGTVFTMKAGKGGCAGDPTSDTGVYELRLTSYPDGRAPALSFIVLNDNCDPRKTGTRGFLPYIQAQP